MSVEAGVLKYLRDSRLAAPWDKPACWLTYSKPLEGFNPLIYASDNEKFDARGLQDLLHILSARDDLPDVGHTEF